MLSQFNGFVSEELNTKSLKDRLSPYIGAWPIFLSCILICVAAGVFYLRYSIPKYESSTVFLVKNSEQEASRSNDIINEVMDGKRQVNMNNEVMLLGSTRLMERTVMRNNFNISYYIKGRLHNIDVYNDAPFLLEVNNLIDSTKSYNFEITGINSKGGSYSFGDDKKATVKSFEWNKPFQADGQTFTLRSKGVLEKNNGDFIVRWQPVAEFSGRLISNFNVDIYDSKANAISLTIKTENLHFGEGVLNALFKEFQLMNIEERSKLSETTVAFIDDRLLNISKELKGVEGNLENYQGSNMLVDIKGQSTQSLENANEASKAVKEIRIQQGIASMISNYFSNPANNNKLVPSSLGLGDPTLASLLTQYNEVQLKREREEPLVAPNSTVMQDLNSQLTNLKTSILESLNNLNKNLMLQENSFKQQTNQYQNFLSSVPHNERVLQEIRRKQSITEGLYLYLLQKREEAAISSTASSIPHYQQIDTATGYGPIEPNKKNILISAALVGFFLAFAFVYSRSLFKDEINSKYELERLTDLPIVGEVAHVSNLKKNLITVLDRSLVSEQFRAIRTNLFFSLKKKNKKIIMVTSSIGREGKSSVSLNLAAACAMPGKKVALLEFDMRKPGISNSFNWQNTHGITDYLTGKTKDLSQLYHFSDELPTLHIYSSGLVPSNPADVLIDENLQPLFEELQQYYDYIIIDTAPASMVCDAFVLSNYSDAVVYVFRQRLSTKKQVEFLNEAHRLKRLNNLVLLLNDVKTGYKYGNYGYGYDGKNGYYQSSKQVKKDLTWNHREVLDVKN